MSSLTHKIDFAVVIRVDHANPNGDPLNGNRPRTDYEGYGEISDVCLKRKIRDRMLEYGRDEKGKMKSGYNILIQSDDNKIDDMASIRKRAESDIHGIGAAIFSSKNHAEIVKKACAHWFDVRSFGQLFAFSKDKKGKKDSDDAGKDGAGLSLAIRGPVSLHSAFSVEPVSVTSLQITKSASGEKEGDSRGSDTMGMKHRVDKGIYVFKGSMNPQLAERTGFSDADAEIIKFILPRMFENDASSARPEGSMSVLKVFWWQHSCKAGQYSSARVHGSLSVDPDGTCHVDETATPGLKPEVIEGF